MPRIRTHPGQLLRAELDARNLSANQLALAIRVPTNRITAILRAERSITADTAVRLGRNLGSGAAFWMNLQSQFDISLVEATKGDAIDRELADMVRHPKDKGCVFGRSLGMRDGSQPLRMMG